METIEETLKGNFELIKNCSRKIPTRKIPTQKIPAWNIPTYLINCLSLLNTSSINAGRESVHVHPLPFTKNFDISRTAHIAIISVN